jgi:hypothetical protein
MTRPADAFLMFHKWHAEKTRLVCVGTFYGWNLQLQGRVSAASEAEITFDHLDGIGQIVLEISQADMGFEYMEPKDAPPQIREQVPESDKNVGTIVVSLPLRFSIAQYQHYERFQGVPKREKLLFMEAPEGRLSAF